MPLITRLFLKTGLVYFLGSLIMGILLQFPSLGIPNLVPLFWHMLMLGWITQIIFGISVWMFPGRLKEESFKNQRWSWLAYALLNTGLILRIISEPVIVTSGSSIWEILITVSAVTQFLAVVCYVIEIWPRVLSPKKRRLQKKAKKG
jgi:heme/copper-type cytochrome/quinol oxidase subunit 1